MRRASARCGLTIAEDAAPSWFFACSHSLRVQRRGQLEARQSGLTFGAREAGLGRTDRASFFSVGISGSGDARAELARRTSERALAFVCRVTRGFVRFRKTHCIFLYVTLLNFN
jgi:hypothetical protein